VLSVMPANPAIDWPDAFAMFAGGASEVSRVFRSSYKVVPSTRTVTCRPLGGPTVALINVAFGFTFDTPEPVTVVPGLLTGPPLQMVSVVPLLGLTLGLTRALEVDRRSDPTEPLGLGGDDEGTANAKPDTALWEDLSGMSAFEPWGVTAIGGEPTGEKVPPGEKVTV
jgi:hypothetical protein